MNQLSSVGKVIALAIATGLLIVLGITLGTGSAGQHGAPTGSNTNSGAAVTAQAPAQTATGTTAANVSSNPSTRTIKPATSVVIHFITPVKDDIWNVGTQNIISWDKAGNISGSLSLIDAATGQFVGVILPQVGTGQTSYAWNTRDILLSRTNPLKKDVTPGTYKIKLSYDGNNIQPIVSPPFTIIP